MLPIQFDDARSTADWFVRPILNVEDVDASVRFYIDLLGFTSPWRYAEEGKARVAQVERQGCAIILANNLSLENIGRAVIFISLNAEPEIQVTALDTLRAELVGKGVSVKEGLWGYRLLVVIDPDGNQLFFNYPSLTTSSTAGYQKDV